MFLIVGLGNPGGKYVGTPHNAGFLFVDHLREFFGWDAVFSVTDWEYDKYLNAEVSYGKIGQTVKYILMKPHTYMNKSGLSVREALKRFELKPEVSLVLAHDDLDIDLGSHKIQRQKGPKAHNGVDSVNLLVPSLNYLRVRLGVENRENRNIPGEDYVLKKYREDEQVVLKESIADAAKSLRSMLQL